MARPLAEGWREYKRCFCIRTLLTGCKALFARVAIEVTVIVVVAVAAIADS